ncbi:MAG: energy transducer TonB [Nitrospiraceae bacterium]|nr:MAG: energy transducer TonB [Nitrospiraceae bacterium]
MNTQFRASVFSVAVHALIFAAVLVLSRYMPANKILVLDFSLAGVQESKAGANSDTPRKASAKKQKPSADSRKAKVISRESGIKKAEQRPVRPSSDDVPAVPVSDSHQPVLSEVSPDMNDREAVVDTLEGRTNDSSEGIKQDAGTVSGRDVADTAEGAKAGYLREHFTYIRDRILKNLSYPQAARKMGWQGKVTISFVICENGNAEDIKIIESSGFGILDRSAVETVKKVLPFPEPPLRAEIVIPVVYRLN